MVLIVALVVMVATVLAAIALVASVDVATLVSGNLAFRQSSVQASDQGVEVARKWLMSTTFDLGTRNPGTAPFYFPTWNGGVTPGMVFDPTNATSFAWNDVQSQSLAAVAGNTVRYVVHRMCLSDGAPSQTTATGEPNCFMASAPSSGGESNLIKDPNSFFCYVDGVNRCTSSGNPYYRITVMVTGPRNTTTYVQAVIY